MAVIATDAMRASPRASCRLSICPAAICLFVNGAKGMSAVQFSRDLDAQYKTAFVLAHKLREALSAETRTKPLKARSKSTVHFFGGGVRPESPVRLPPRRHRPARARWPPPDFVRNLEAEGVDIARARVLAGSKLFADEASRWDVLAWWPAITTLAPLPLPVRQSRRMA